MDSLEYARRFICDFKVVKGNIQAKHCPICGGGKHRDKYTFGLSIEKQVYKCHRGSCGAEGHLTELLKEKGITTATQKEYKKTEIRKDYKKPVLKNIVKIGQAGIDYAKLRGISEDTLLHFNVEQKNKSYVFNYYNETGELTFVKYRPIGRISPGSNQKALRERDTMPILYNMNNIDAEQDLVICEGEFDALAVYEAGYKNVTSVPSGCSDLTWLDTCWDFLEEYKGDFILYGDNDIPGIKMIKELQVKLGDHRVKIVKHEGKDANEDLYKFGKSQVLTNIEKAEYCDKLGLLDVADIHETENQESVPTGFRPIDRLLEDCQMGDLTVWTGKNGAGKSTVLGQVILEAIDREYKVFCYSGELTGYRFQQWITMQAAGAQYIESYRNKYNDVRFKTMKKAENKIKNWYKNKLFLYDNNIKSLNVEASKIIDLCRFAAKRHNCKVFVIDNLMTSDFESKNNNDYYRAQSEFVGELVNFAKTFNVHVHLVAHPRKTQGLIDKDSVGGTGDITNRADNVIAIERFNNDDETKAAVGEKNFVQGVHGMLNLLKNRNTGEVGCTFLKFNKSTRRMTPVDKNGLELQQKEYSWNAEKLDNMQVVEEQEPLPF